MKSVVSAVAVMSALFAGNVMADKPDHTSDAALHVMSQMSESGIKGEAQPRNPNKGNINTADNSGMSVAQERIAARLSEWDRS